MNDGHCFMGINGITYFYNVDFLQNDDGEIQPGYEDLVINVTDNFDNLGRVPGSSTIMLNVNLTTKNELKCEVLLNNHQYCVDTTRIQFQGKCMNNSI